MLVAIGANALNIFSSESTSGSITDDEIFKLFSLANSLFFSFSQSCKGYRKVSDRTFVRYAPENISSYIKG